jgi:sugar phosphate isomerase/epimerase
MDISISTSILGREKEENYSLKQGLEMVKNAGYHFIELSRKHKNLSSLHSFIQSMGIKIWSVHGTLGSEAISSDRSKRTQAVEKEFGRMENVSDYAPCPYVIHYLNRFNDPEIAVTWRKSVEKLLDKAVALNLNLSVETAPYKPEVHERYADSKEISDFVRLFKSSNIGVCIDINHSNLREDISSVAQNCSGIISDIHVSDNHGIREEHLLPGMGIINFPLSLKEIIKAGYSGPCNLECHADKKLTVEVLKDIRVNAEKFVSEIT